MKQLKRRALAAAMLGFCSGVLSMLMGAPWNISLLISIVVFLVLMTLYIAFEFNPQRPQ